jgi:peptidoglycan L-alanyl-D-glutamate endopeptidase CwlK
MTASKQGSKSPQVKNVQKKLKKLGYNPGRLDGIFGKKTRAALIRFQKSRGLVADGIVGPQTLAALSLRIAERLTSIISLVTMDIVTRMFPFTPESSIETNLPFVLTALEKEKLTDRILVLVALSTIRAEAECFEPISELISRFNTSPGGRPFDLYDYRRDLGNKGPPDGEKFRGRGFIQLTGRINYREYGDVIGLGNELVDNPENANQADVAAQLLAAYLKDREEGIRDAARNDDLKTTRRLINGGSHGLDRFTDAFRIGEKLIANS